MIKKFQRNNYLYNDIKNNEKENKYIIYYQNKKIKRLRIDKKIKGTI